MLAPFWLKPGIAYTKITQFTETTSREMDEGLKRLGEANIKGLVLDLRDNPGGLLNEGVEVAGALPEEGRDRSFASWACFGRKALHRAPRQWRQGLSDRRAGKPLLGVGRGDRRRCAAGSRPRLDSGRNTFGKGLVQTVYPLSENSGLALTTAHYYTPSGRLIQRDYSNISFLDYYYNRKGDHEEHAGREDDRQRPYGVRRRRHHARTRNTRIRN